MISRLLEEQSNLFTLLSAQAWRDDHPKLLTFASQLLSNKDPWKAHSLMVCKQGITQFFCMGYAALDVNVWPGGFTIFMFWPKKQAVRAIIGDCKVDDKTVSYFAQNKLYLEQTP
jgi:hypothetical protein